MQLAARCSSRACHNITRRILQQMSGSSTPCCRLHATSGNTFQAATPPRMTGGDDPERRRPVVTAIIRRGSDGKLLLVKRSDQVGSYQQHWGGVSGGVEGRESLLHRALQEISEEAGLAPQQLQLVTAGRPLPVDDGRRHFLVYPFLFQLTDDEASVVLNWENVEFAWTASSVVPQLQHVPLLPETVGRLLLPPHMAVHVAYLQSDRSHGAAELAAYVLQAMRDVVAHEERVAPSAAPEPTSSVHHQQQQQGGAAAPADSQQQHHQQQQEQPPETFQGCLEAYRNVCFHMALARPSMAAIANAAAGVLLQLEAELDTHAAALDPSVGLARVALANALDKLAAAHHQQQADAVHNTAAVLAGGMRVLTTSLSSTVAEVLIEAHNTAVQAAAAAAGQQQAGGQSAPGEAAADASSARDWLLVRLAAGGMGSTQQLQQQHLPRFKGCSRGPGLSVVVCESRPLCEGVTMARRLAAAGLAVTLITDAQAGVFVGDVDAVLLGADAVTPEGVVNKVGSRLLALAARAAGVPVLAVTNTLKVSPGPVASIALPNTTLQVDQEEKGPEELLPAWGDAAAAAVTAAMQQAGLRGLQQQQRQRQQQQPATAAAATGSSSSGGGHSAPTAGDASSLAPGGSIQVCNVYFEAVPLQLVTAIISEQGVLRQQAVSQLMQERVREYQAAFELE